MLDSLRILKENEHAGNKSLLYFLHERNVFNSEAYWQLYNALLDISKIKAGKEITSSIKEQIFFCYSQVVKHFLYHLSDRDEYTMKDFPEEHHMDYIQRLSDIIDSIFKGSVYDEKLFDDGLINPLADIKSEVK